MSKKDVNEIYGNVSYRVGSKELEKNIKTKLSKAMIKLNKQTKHRGVTKSQFVAALFINFIDEVDIGHIKKIRGAI